MRLTKRARLLLVLMTVFSTGAFFAPIMPALALTAGITFDGGGDLDYDLYPYRANVQTVQSGGYSGNGLISDTSTDPTESGCGTAAGDAYVGVVFDWTPTNTITNLKMWIKGTSSMPGTMNGKWQAYIGGTWSDISGAGFSDYGLNNGWQQRSFNVSVSGATQLRVYFGACWGQSLKTYLDEIEITYSDDGPTPTPTNTPTATFTPTPSGYTPPIAAPSCLNLANGPSFRVGWTPRDGAEITSGELHLPPGGSATSLIILDLSKRYDIRVYYTHSGGDGGDLARFRVGATSYILPMQDGSGTFSELFTQNNVKVAREGTFGDLIGFEFAYDPGMLDANLQIQWWCIAPVGELPVAGAITDTYYESCFECIYQPISSPDLIEAFNNIGNWFGWLWCSLRRFFECQLWIILGDLLQGVLDLLNFIKGGAEWLWATISGAIEWAGSLIGQVLEWIVATGANIITGIGNVLSGLWDFLSAFFTTIGLIIQTIFETVVAVVKIVIYVIDAVIRAVVGGVVAFINWAAEIFGLGQVVVDGINDGFNRDVGDTISGSLACDNPSGALYPVCLGFYVLDNTIFDGPGYWVFIVFIGVFSLDTLLWAVEKLRHGVLTQDA